MQNRFLAAVSVEQLRHQLNIATELSSSFTDDDKRELLKLAQDPSLPNKHTQSDNLEYAEAYAKYHDILRKGSLATASEPEQHMAKIFFGALALQLLPEEVQQKLSKEIIYDRTRTELGLVDKQLTGEDAFCLSHVLPLTTIIALNLHWNNIGDTGAAALAKNQTLTTLKVSANQIRDAGAIALAANQTLTTLNVRGNKIRDAGAAAFATNQTLTTLSVRGNKIGDAGAVALAANKTLTTLNLSGTRIGDTGAKALAANKTLTTLDVSYNKIRDDGAKALAENQTLTTLDVSYIKIGDDGVKALAENQTLTTLDVSYNKIGDDGAKALAENQTLTTLDVSYNNIGDDGAKVLAKNRKLTTLDITHNQIGDAGAKALAANRTLTTLYVNDVYSSIDAEGKKALDETNPVARYNMGKSVGVNTPFPSLARQAMFAVKTNPDTRLPSGKTMQEEADEILPEEIKEKLKKPKV
jgi:Leucine-rich repeat (LRR) protein